MEEYRAEESLSRIYFPLKTLEIVHYQILFISRSIDNDRRRYPRYNRRRSRSRSEGRRRDPNRYEKWRLERNSKDIRTQWNRDSRPKKSYYVLPFYKNR